jgi:hypothetical protein
MTNFATPASEPLLTVAQVDYLRKQLLDELPALMNILQHVIQKETVRVRDINADEVQSSGGDPRTQDAANVNALQAKIDIEKVLLDWSLNVARYREVEVRRRDGSVICTTSAGRPAHRKAVDIAVHVAENIAWLSRYDFMGRDGRDFYVEVTDAIKSVRLAIGDDAKEFDDQEPEVLPRNAAQIARESGYDKPMVASAIVRAMNKKGYPNLKVHNLHQWAFRGHISPKGPRIGKSPQYLMSDVMEVAQREGRNIAKRHPDSYLDDVEETLV